MRGVRSADATVMASASPPASGVLDGSGGLKPKRAYGIVLGATFSAIAYVDEHGKPVIIPNQESERITPSAVLFDGENIIVGDTSGRTLLPPQAHRAMGLVEKKTALKRLQGLNKRWATFLLE